MLKELHSIKRFRDGRLGIIRLNKLAIPKDIIIKLGDKEFEPISYDTYGHPIISEANFIYYKALKSIREREGESLVAEVQYKHNAFVIRRDVYDSVKGIEEAVTLEKKELETLKKILNYRKQANFLKKELNTFILFGKYALYSDGHVYACSYQKKDETGPDKIVLELSEVVNFELHEELHIPGHNDVCAVCGKKFDIDDIKEFGVTEDNNSRKAHRQCLTSCIESVNYQQASKIIDSVYQDVPQSEIIKKYEDGKEKVWYLYHTKQGDVALRFKNKVIEIEWHGNFKPFNLQDLFKDEDVTKRKLEDSKIIHAWSADDAIKYLMMVKKI